MLSYIILRSTAAFGGAPFRLNKCTALGSAGSGGRFGVLVYIAGAWEQIFPVPQRRHIDRIQGKRFFVHDVDRHMGKVEVFQLHLANIVVVRYFHVIVVSFAVCPCLSPIAHLHFHGLRQNVLLFKEHLQLRLNLVDGEHPFMERRENGDQHIRVMLDLIQIKTVFVISGVQSLGNWQKLIWTV